MLNTVLRTYGTRPTIACTLVNSPCRSHPKFTGTGFLDCMKPPTFTHMHRSSFHTSIISRSKDSTDDKIKLPEGLAAHALLGQLELAKKNQQEDAEPAGNSQDQQPATKNNDPPGSSLPSIVLFSTLFVSALWYFGGPTQDDESLSPSSIASRISARYKKYIDSFSLPAYEKLLPDPLPPPYQKEYTLIINLNDTMIHPTWDSQHGWRIAKRPDLDYFLGYLSRFYEIVVFTRSQGHSAQPILDKIDTYQSILYRLYRDATLYKDGEYIKDLTNLNRDLSKVIIMDWDETAYSLHPENAIQLQRWDGSPNIRSLKDYIPFLEMVVLRGVPDVRTVLQLYKGLDIPTTFAQRQAEFRRRLADEMKMDKAAPAEATEGFASRLKGLLGANSSRFALQHQHQQQLELQRHAQLHQKQFEEESQLIKKEIERARHLQELEIQKQITAMTSQKTTLAKMILEMVTMMMDPEAQLRQQQEMKDKLASSMAMSSPPSATA